MGFPPRKRYRKFQKGSFSSNVLRKTHVEIRLMSYLQQLWNLNSKSQPGPPNSTGALSISADIVPYSVPYCIPISLHRVMELEEPYNKDKLWP